MNTAANAPRHRSKASRRAFLVGMLVAALAALVALGLAGCGPKQVEVPDLEHMDQAEAEKALTDAGLTLGKVSEEPGGDILIGGFVWKQSPEAGKKVDEKSAVDIVVGTGPKLTDPVSVADVTGKTIEEAEEIIIDQLLIPQPGEPQHSDTVEPGKVCAQSPAPGTQLMPLETVTYSVSLGKEQVAVPDVVGKPEGEARTLLANAQLGCDTTQSYNDKVAKGNVIGQSIAKDMKVDKGTVITIDISLGPKPPAKVKVPNIMTYNLAGALGAIQSAGLGYSYSGDEGGTVTSVDPAPGTEVEQGSTVTFTLTAPQPAQPAQEPEEPQQVEPDEPEIVKNHLSKADVKEIVKLYELGKISSMEKVTNDNNVQYWMVDVVLSNGDVVTYLIDPNGEIF